MDEMGLAKTPMTFQQKMRQMVDDLLVLLDGMEDDPDLEPTAGGTLDDECEPEETEPSLGSLDRVMNQDHAWRGGYSDDTEQDDSDAEEDDPDEAKQHRAGNVPVRVTRLLAGRLCFRLSLRLAMAGAIISGLDATRPAFPVYHS